MRITRVTKRNKKEIDLSIFSCDKDVMESSTTHDRIVFICEKCNNEGARVRSKFNSENDFLCKKCKLSIIKKGTKPIVRSREYYQELAAKRTKESFEKAKKTRVKSNLQKYGVENVSQLQSSKDKMAETNLDKYGCKAPLQNETVKQKVEQTNLKKYGYKTPIQNETIKIKTEQTNLEKYGYKSSLQNETVREKAKSTILERYGVDNAMKNNVIKEKSRISNIRQTIKDIKDNGFTPLFDIDNYTGKIDKNYQWRCNKCETVFEDKMYSKKTLPRCPKCNPFLKGTSQGEQELQTFTQGKKYRDRFEIDALVNNIGFEFNGLYWHSEKFKEAGYHLMKTDYFKEKGIQVYHIFEDEWRDEKEIVKSIINSKLNRLQTTIYGRKCEIKEVDTKVSRVFQDENHIQGKANAVINVGLYYEDELVSLMTFGKSRFDNKVEWELVRFVNKKNTRVLGGASKCFKYFIRNYNPINIVSYSDTRLFGGEMYEKLGFEFIHNTRPQYYYVKNGKRYNRMRFQKSKLKDLFEDYDINKTERQMMAENNFLRIYDCGMKVWVYENKV